MAPPKDIARSYPKRGLTADVGFRSEPKFCGDGSTDFDGTADKATAAIYNPSGDFLTTTAWVNADTIRNQGLIHNGNAGRNSFLFYMGGSGNLLFYWNDTTGDAAISHQTNLVAGQWYHLAAVMDMSDAADHQVTWYINGIAATGARTSSSWVGDGTYQIGNQYASAGWFDGKVANCRIYDAALTQDQVRELYNNPGLDFPSGLTASNLRRHYKLETDFNDSGADSENATASGSPSFTVNRPQLPRGLDLTGGFKSPPLTFDGDCVKLDGSTQGATSATTYSIVTSGAKTTIAGWALPRSLTGGNQTLFGNAVNGGSDNFAIYQTGTNELAAIAIYAGGATSVRAAAKNLDKDRWYFLAATFDYDTTTLKFYVDGVEFSETPFLGYGGTGGLFEIGFRDDPGGDIQFFDGNLAHVMLIEDVLTQGEIVELMRDTTYAKAQTFGTVNRYYELDADFNDDTGSHNATSIGSPAFVNVKANPTRMSDPSRGASMARVYSGRAVEFDGSADYLETTLDAALGSTFTVTAWIYKDNVSSNRFIMLTGASGAGGIASIFVNADKLGGFDGAANLNTTLSLSAGRWYHVALVANGTTTLTYYLNGQSDTVTSAAVPNPNGTTFRVGAYSPSALLHDGKISGMKVFNQALTADQIKDLYHHPEQVLPTGVSASALIHCWALSDYNDATAGGTGGRYFQDSAGDNALEDKSSASMSFAQPVPCPQLGLQQSATRLYHPGGTQGATATITAPGTTVSLSAWVLWDSARISYAISLGNVVSTSGDGFQIRINASGQITMFQRDGGGTNQELLSGLTVTEGEWNHIVVATRSDSPYWRCWLNNSEASSPNALVNTVNVTSTNCNLGMNSGSFGMAGIANDAAVWNTELGDSDVAALYNSGVQGMDVGTVQASNLKGWWKFDDLTTLKDYSGNGANATVTGTFAAASFPENASGSTIVGDFSLKRKGVSVLNPTATPAVTSDLIRAEIANDGSLNPNPTNGGYTASVFIRLEQQDIGGSTWVPMILGNSTAVSSLNYLLFYFPGTNASVPIRLSIGDGTITNRVYNYPSALPNPEEWHQVAFTIDFSTSPTTFRLYQDGALVSTQATHNHSASDLGNLNVGSYWSGNGNFPGAIACVKIYQTKLSDNEIEQIYNSDLRLIKGLENE